MLIFFRLSCILFLLLSETCFLISNRVHASPLLSEGQSSPQTIQISPLNPIITQQKDSCLKIRRPLNPSTQPQPSETVLDRYFRIAYNAEVAGDFDTAIINYRRAANLATCDCDRLHAQAGEKAAQEAKALLKTEGEKSQPTQFFWGRLQELTKFLPCVVVQ